jgi:hypothetical protein
MLGATWVAWAMSAAGAVNVAIQPTHRQTDLGEHLKCFATFA